MNSSKSSLLTSHTNFSSDFPPLQIPNRPTQGQKKAIAQIYLEQAHLFYQEDDWQQALVACKNALEIAPNTVEAYQILGDILYRQGKQAKALGIYAKALTIDPNFAPVYANLGQLHAEQENWHQALDYYQQAVTINPNLAQAHLGLARVWEELEDLEQALEYFCRAVDLDRNLLSSEEYFSFGRDLHRQGKLQEASIFLIQGIKLDPNAESELSLLVQILEDLEEWQQAVSYYQQLISLPDRTQEELKVISDRKPIKKLLFTAQSRSRKTAKTILAKNTIREIPSLPPDVALKLLPKAQPQIANKQSPAVLPVAPEELQPDSALAWNNLGSSYAQKQEWAKAIGCYQEALELDPNYAKSHRNLARVYNNLGEELKAALCWYDAFSLESEQVKPEDYYSLATKLLEHQEQDKAIACLRWTIQLQPGFAPAYLTLGKLLESQGKSEEAAACYARIA